MSPDTSLVSNVYVGTPAATIAFNKSDFTQTVLEDVAAAEASDPTVHVHGLFVVVPDASIDVRSVFIGQTEPPLVRLIDADTVANLALNASDYTFWLRVKRKSDGQVMVDGAATYTLQDDDTALLTYYFAANDFDEAGEHYLQFRAIRNADQRVLCWASELMAVRET